MYKIKSAVRYSECGHGNTITIPAIINYFQDCSTANSEVLGVGREYLIEHHRAWILNSWHIIINRYPHYMEEIEVSTWAIGFKGVFGPRAFCMKTKEGEVLACANSLWVCVDTQTGRPKKPNKEEIEMYGVEEPLNMEQVSRKIIVPEGAMEVDRIKVRSYHIDTNHHMNNCQYIQIAMEVLPEGYQVRQVRAEYKKSAVYNDMILIKRVIEGTKIVIELCDEEDITYAVVEFIGEQ